MGGTKGEAGAVRDFTVTDAADVERFLPTNSCIKLRFTVLTAQNTI